MKPFSSLLTLFVLAAAACGGSATSAPSTTTPPTSSSAADLPVAAPETAGFSSTQLAALTPYLASIHSPAGVVLVHGTIIFAWGDLAQKMQVHSIRKSFLSSLYGNAVASKQIALSSTLAELGVDDIAPSLTDTEKQATVEDLLEARSGVYHVANYETADEAKLRPPRGAYSPGTYWYYNNWDFNAAGGIYEAATQTSIFDAFEREIARPIGMQDYTAADGSLDEDEAISKYPAYLFNMSTRDMARFGLLYLHHGKNGDTQIVPEDWIAKSVESDSDNPDFPGNGYGYLWWVGITGEGLFRGVDVGPGAFAAEGSGGHYIAVLPAYDMVIVNRADDAYYNDDKTDRNIGMNRMGNLVSIILNSKSPP